MKRAFSTVACHGYSMEQVIESAIKANICALEVRLNEDDSFWGLSIEAVMEALKYFKQKQIVITDLCTSIAFFDYEPVKISRVKTIVDLAENLKVTGIRLFLGRFIKKFSEEAKENYDGIVKSLLEACVYAEEKGVEIWVETHNNFSSGRVLHKLIEDVGSPNLKIIWDVIHPIEFGENPCETLKFLGDRIAHVHIKDGFKAKDANQVNYIYSKLGEGEVPIKEILCLLEETGYSGFYSLEWEKPWRPEIKDIFSNLSEVLEHFNSYMDEQEANIYK